MNEFKFFPELLETRAHVIAELTSRGYDWLGHYASVDPLHDLYGIEVCGIHEEQDARGIMCALKQLFPNWRRYRVYLKDWGIEPGWEARIHRDPEREEPKQFSLNS
jgi:hypothetical protein